MYSNVEFLNKKTWQLHNFRFIICQNCKILKIEFAHFCWGIRVL